MMIVPTDGGSVLVASLMPRRSQRSGSYPNELKAHSVVSKQDSDHPERLHLTDACAISYASIY